LDRGFKFGLSGLIFAAFFLWLVALGNVPLRDWDEGYYGVVARDIFRTGNWLYPTYLGEPFLFKPPLMMWLITVSYHLGGISEFTTRFSGTFLTALGVPLLYLLGEEVFKRRRISYFSALVYLTLLPVVRHGRLAMFDGAINTFWIFAFFCLLKARKDSKWAVGFGIAMGAIALTKGILVLALGAIAMLFIISDRQFKLFKSFSFWLGILLGFLPAIFWYGAQIQHYGNEFIQFHFYEQSIERVATTIEGHDRAFYYYFIELIKYTIPWLVFLPGGIWLAWRERRQSWSKLIFVGMGSYMGIISLMGTKLPWYIMPVYPFVALAVGAYLEQWHQQKYSRFYGVIFIVLAILALGGCGYFISSDPQPILIVMALTLSVTMALVAWRIQKSDRRFIPILFIGTYLSLFLFFNSHSWVWEINEAFPVKPVAELIRKNTPSDTTIYTSFGYSRPSLDFYSDRRVISVDKIKLQQLQSKGVYLLIEQSTLDTLNLANFISLGMANGFHLILSQPNRVN
jgi:4-amino-4-deoxy-L-arabinose transferase-like glycosyltransferase